jgi:hypothetical protein
MRANSKALHHKACIDRRRKRLTANPDNTLPSDIGRTRTRVIYWGAPCLRGHSGERYITGHCVTCLREKLRGYMARRRKNAPKKLAAGQKKAHKKWYAKQSRNRRFRIEQKLRSRIGNLFRTGRSPAALALLGVGSLEEYKAYIAAKFSPGMIWKNYGRSGWVIDHIKPIQSFDLTDPRQQKLAFHHLNTQPLWTAANIRKGSR